MLHHKNYTGPFNYFTLSYLEDPNMYVRDPDSIGFVSAFIKIDTKNYI